MKVVLTFDLDGTLIKSGNQIIGGDKTLAYLREIQKMGVELIGNTGRLDHDITSISEAYNFIIDHRISQNGAVVVNDHEAKAKLLDKDEALKVLDFLESKPEVRSEVNSISNRYWKNPRGPLRPKEYYDSHIIKKNFRDVIVYQPVVLFLCLGKKEDLVEIKSFVNTHCQKLYAVSTSPKSLEILTTGVSKGNTLRDLFPDAYIFGIGDSENDHSVFEQSNDAYYVGTEPLHDITCHKVARIDIALEMILVKLKEMNLCD